MRLTARAVGVVVVGATLILSGCGRSPFEIGDEGGNGTTPSAGPTEPTETTSTEEETEGETEEETEGPNFVATPDVGGEDPLTCREILECLMGCLGDLGLECLGACAEGADPQEAALAGELMTCVVGLCIDNGQCTIDNITSEDCIGCIGLGMLVPEPPGCEEQGAACQ